MPSMPRISRAANCRNIAQATARIPVIGTDQEARTDAFVRVLEFLKLHLESN